MKTGEMNATIMRVFVWSGVVLVAALIFAQGWMMGFIPAPPPSLSAEELARIFIERKDSILIGALLQCICWSFWFTWATPIMVFIRRAERSWPILTYASIACVGGGYVFFLLIPMTWAVIAFRADTLAPGIIQIMNDWVWFDWLFTWPPFSIWMFIIGAAVLVDHNTHPAYPRWVGYFNFWCGVLIVPAGMIGFFKTGPFAYNGLISFWFAVVVFFGWIITMTVMTLRAITAEERRAAVVPKGERARGEPLLRPTAMTQG